MSNQQVGTVYDRVIHDVCEASQVDFEEGGVDQQTLEEMRTSWQQKLSHLAVAHFPWDPPLQPTPPPPSQPSNTPLPPATTVPSNAPRPTPPPQQQQNPSQQSQPLPGPEQSTQPPVPGQVQNVPPSNVPGQGPQIKTEPGLNGQHGMPGFSSGPQALSNAQALARERAMNNLQSKYGAAAANSVSQLQAQSQTALSLPGQQRTQNGQLPNGVPPDVKPPQPYQGVPQPRRAPYNPPQTDGTDEALIEWKAEVARRREAAQHHNGEGDRLLIQQLRLQALRLEGGGLMLPLDEHPSLSLSKATSARALTAPAQVDGTDDDEKVEEDEDAINSDLDDPDDLVAEEHDGDDAVGQVMLCTYDKVQRVKNKWKCTLKDGILSTGGKEYVFHKGQGEFEW